MIALLRRSINSLKHLMSNTETEPERDNDLGLKAIAIIQFHHCFYSCKNNSKLTGAPKHTNIIAKESQNEQKTARGRLN